MFALTDVPRRDVSQVRHVGAGWRQIKGGRLLGQQHVTTHQTVESQW